MRSSLLVRMRSSLVVRASDCQCTSCNGPGFNTSIRRHSGIWGAADEAVLNTVRKNKKSPKKYLEKKHLFLHIWRNLWSSVKNICGKASRPKIPTYSKICTYRYFVVCTIHSSTFYPRSGLTHWDFWRSSSQSKKRAKNYHCNGSYHVDPDPVFLFDTDRDPDPALHFNAETDPILCRSGSSWHWCEF